ncbi:unnamed protein product [Amoebophrya sp. A120]|nr:unnamed protein product [Amoebophrya sp. A120]|eukprot:GSA120T00017446001.1
MLVPPPDCRESSEAASQVQVHRHSAEIFAPAPTARSRMENNAPMRAAPFSVSEDDLRRIFATRGEILQGDIYAPRKAPGAGRIAAHSARARERKSHVLTCYAPTWISKKRSAASGGHKPLRSPNEAYFLGRSFDTGENSRNLRLGDRDEHEFRYSTSHPLHNRAGAGHYAAPPLRPPLRKNTPASAVPPAMTKWNSATFSWSTRNLLEISRREHQKSKKTTRQAEQADDKDNQRKIVLEAVETNPPRTTPEVPTVSDFFRRRAEPRGKRKRQARSSDYVSWSRTAAEEARRCSSTSAIARLKRSMDESQLFWKKFSPDQRISQREELPLATQPVPLSPVATPRASIVVPTSSSPMKGAPSSASSTTKKKKPRLTKSASRARAPKPTPDAEFARRSSSSSSVAVHTQHSHRNNRYDLPNRRAAEKENKKRKSSVEQRIFWIADAAMEQSRNADSEEELQPQLPPAPKPSPAKMPLKNEAVMHFYPSPRTSKGDNALREHDVTMEQEERLADIDVPIFFSTKGGTTNSVLSLFSAETATNNEELLSAGEQQDSEFSFTTNNLEGRGDHAGKAYSPSAGPRKPPGVRPVHTAFDKHHDLGSIWGDDTRVHRKHPFPTHLSPYTRDHVLASRKERSSSVSSVGAEESEEILPAAADGRAQKLLQHASTSGEREDVVRLRESKEEDSTTSPVLSPFVLARRSLPATERAMFSESPGKFERRDHSGPDERGKLRVPGDSSEDHSLEAPPDSSPIDDLFPPTATFLADLRADRMTELQQLDLVSATEFRRLWAAFARERRLRVRFFWVRNNRSTGLLQPTAWAPGGKKKDSGQNTRKQYQTKEPVWRKPAKHVNSTDENFKLAVWMLHFHVWANYVRRARVVERILERSMLAHRAERDLCILAHWRAAAQKLHKVFSEKEDAFLRQKALRSWAKLTPKWKRMRKSGVMLDGFTRWKRKGETFFRWRIACSYEERIRMSRDRQRTRFKRTLMGHWLFLAHRRKFFAEKLDLWFARLRAKDAVSWRERKTLVSFEHDVAAESSRDDQEDKLTDTAGSFRKRPHLDHYLFDPAPNSQQKQQRFSSVSPVLTPIRKQGTRSSRRLSDGSRKEELRVRFESPDRSIARRERHFYDENCDEAPPKKEGVCKAPWPVVAVELRASLFGVNEAGNKNRQNSNSKAAGGASSSTAASFFAFRSASPLSAEHEAWLDTSAGMRLLAQFGEQQVVYVQERPPEENEDDIYFEDPGQHTTEQVCPPPSWTVLSPTRIARKRFFRYWLLARRHAAACRLLHNWSALQTWRLYIIPAVFRLREWRNLAGFFIEQKIASKRRFEEAVDLLKITLQMWKHVRRLQWRVAVEWQEKQTIIKCFRKLQKYRLFSQKQKLQVARFYRKTTCQNAFLRPAFRGFVRNARLRLEHKFLRIWYWWCILGGKYRSWRRNFNTRQQVLRAWFHLLSRRFATETTLVQKLALKRRFAHWYYAYCFQKKQRTQAELHRITFSPPAASCA